MAETVYTARMEDCIRVTGKKCIVMGAGPAGLSAAIAAARAGCSVVVLEKNDKPGRKLLLAGGGRANVIDPETSGLQTLDAFGKSGRFLRPALAAFDYEGFLRNLNIKVEREEKGIRQGCLYVQGGAKELLAALLKEATRLGVEFVYGAAVKDVKRIESGGFEVTTSGESWNSDRFIIATGGMTYPQTGSSGDGYRLAEKLGHEIDPPRPALAALVTDPCFEELTGVPIPDASMTIRHNGKKIASRQGGLLFTHTGVSGPPVLDLSLELARAVKDPGGVTQAELLVDAVPDLSRDQLVSECLKAASDRPKVLLENAGLLPGVSSRVIRVIAGVAGFDHRKPIGQVSKRDWQQLADILKSLTLEVVEPLDPRGSIVTTGGISGKAVDPATLQSGIVPGLYFAGEVLAPAGPCGGYNLLIAFATGDLVGNAVGVDSMD